MGHTSHGGLMRKLSINIPQCSFKAYVELFPLLKKMADSMFTAAEFLSNACPFSPLIPLYSITLSILLFLKHEDRSKPHLPSHAIMYS